MKTKSLFMLFLAMGLSANLKAQAAEYHFCVQSDAYETFKARVVFRGLDFGETSARMMVLNDLGAVLEGEFKVTSFDEHCDCYGDCPQVEVTSKDWDGNIGNRQEGVNGMWGSAVEITDNIVSEGKALWDNPGQFLMTRILGKD
tara:strand:+ start:1317 stop:1748 length:432 start_codon:yes stop_codon:yes gene_type:complete